MVHPIVDEYYNSSPDFKRSSKLVISKGLDTNEKPITLKGASPMVTPGFSSPNTSNELAFSEMKCGILINQNSHANPVSNGQDYGVLKDQEMSPVFKNEKIAAAGDLPHRRPSMVGNFRFPNTSKNHNDSLYTDLSFLHSSGPPQRNTQKQETLINTSR